MSIQSISPTSGQPIRTYDSHTRSEIESILRMSDEAHRSWTSVGFPERAGHMKKAGQILRDRTEDLAMLMAEEMGKPIRQGRSEVEKCAWVCDYYAENGERFLANESVETDASESFVTYQPLGVVLAVMPWNFPFWQVFRFAAPNLMAGNSGVLKHASNVPGSALAIEEVFRDAGFPEHLFRALMIAGSEVAGVIEHPLVRAVTLTGSTPAGRAVGSKAGQMLKPSVLELGGSDPYVILEDADLESAVEACVTSRLINSGQSCIAAKRFVAVGPLHEAFESRFVEMMAAKVTGDPLSEDTDVGPQARHDLRDDLHRQVLESVQKGAQLLLGGRIPPGPGAYYPPTVLTGVKRGMPAYDDELFGPVAAIIPVVGEEEAIRVANDSKFGLGAAVFTKDVARGRRIAAERLQAGSCFVNAFVKSDPRLPFGGIKESGYGRELARHGIREFVNAKTVYIG